MRYECGSSATICATLSCKNARCSQYRIRWNTVLIPVIQCVNSDGECAHLVDAVYALVQHLYESARLRSAAAGSRTPRFLLQRAHNRPQRPILRNHNHASSAKPKKRGGRIKKQPRVQTGNITIIGASRVGRTRQSVRRETPLVILQRTRGWSRWSAAFCISVLSPSLRLMIAPRSPVVDSEEPCQKRQTRQTKSRNDWPNTTSPRPP